MGNANCTAEVPVPPTMRRIVLAKSDPDMSKVVLQIETVETPTPKSGEVLIRVAAAAVNPSDYGAWTRAGEAAASGSKSESVAKGIGHEGSGVVVATGGGLTTRGLVGKNVGFVGLKGGQGSYSEYVVVDAVTGAFPLPASLPVEDAASFFVNPYTAVGILATAKSHGSPGLIHTAAASSLGKMMVKLCAKNKYPLINVVRRKEQAAALKALGAEHVIVTAGDKATWMAELKALTKKLKVTVAFDAVAGEMSGDLLGLLPSRGVCYVYGGLSNQAVGAINPMDLIYRKKEIKGFLLTQWVRKGGMLYTIPRLRTASATVNSGLQKGGWCSSEFVDTTLDGMWDSFLDMYTKSGFTGRKLRIRISQPSTPAKHPELTAATTDEAADGNAASTKVEDTADAAAKEAETTADADAKEAEAPTVAKEAEKEAEDTADAGAKEAEATAVVKEAEDTHDTADADAKEAEATAAVKEVEPATVVVKEAEPAAAADTVVSGQE